MQDQWLTKPLSLKEQQELSLILSHTSGAPDLVQLDGFFYGVLTLPRPILPSEWLPELFPETTSTKSKAEVERLINLVFRYHNGVADRIFRQQPQPKLDGSLEQADRWTASFARGLTLDPEAFNALGNSELHGKFGVLVFSYAFGTTRLPESLFDGLPLDLIDELREIRHQTQQCFARQSAVENLEMLKGLVTVSMQILTPVRSSTKRVPNRVGRKIGPNEPCPCGSGLKYKRCCGRP